MHVHAEPAAAPATIRQATAQPESRLLTRLRLSRPTALALVWLLDTLCVEPEPREPEGQTLRPTQGPRGQT